MWESESVAESHADLIPVGIAVSGAGVVAEAVSLSRSVSVTTPIPLSAQFARRLSLLTESPTDEELAMQVFVQEEEEEEGGWRREYEASVAISIEA